MLTTLIDQGLLFFCAKTQSICWWKLEISNRHSRLALTNSLVSHAASGAHWPVVKMNREQSSNPILSSFSLVWVSYQVYTCFNHECAIHKASKSVPRSVASHNANTSWRTIFLKWLHYWVLNFYMQHLSALSVLFWSKQSPGNSDFIANCCDVHFLLDTGKGDWILN